jgi:hypothetical protein
MRRLLLPASLILSTQAMAGLLVTDISGKVEMEGKGTVATLAEIPDGAHLALAAGARLVAVDLASGREYVLKGAGKYVAAAGGPKSADGKPVAATPLPAANLPEVKVGPGKAAQATVVMRGIRKYNVPVLHAPARTAVISTRPLFQWSGVEGAASYRLVLKGADGAALWEAAVAGTELTPAPDRALSPGADYGWRIEAVGSDGRSISDASANFSVAPAEVIRRLEALKPPAGAPFGRRVLYAAQLREAGANAAARELWQALAQERPGDEVLKSLAE